MKHGAVAAATTVMALGVLLAGCADGVGYQPSYSYPLLGSFGFAGDWGEGWGGGWDHGHWNGDHAELAHFHGHGFAGHGFGGHGGGGGGHR